MTRRNFLILTLATLATGQASRAADDAGPGLIYAYSWGRSNPRGLDQAIFALDLGPMTWTEVAGQSDNRVFDEHFRVSRDGRSLAFERFAFERGAKGQDRSKSEGVSIRDLTRDGTVSKPNIRAGGPIWHPDGKRMLVNTYLGTVPSKSIPRHESWIMNLDGSDPKKLPIPETEKVDDIAPDGSWFLTVSYRDQGIGYQVYRMKTGGTEAKRLTTTGKGVLNLDGRISPDGRQIAYLRARGDQPGIWVMDADGANPRRVFETTDDERPGGPTWSPDGRKLAIATRGWRKDKDGHDEEYNHQLIVIDLAGGPPLRVPSPLPDGLGNPEWSTRWKP